MLEPLTELWPINGLEILFGLFFLCFAGMWIRLSRKSIWRSVLLTILLSIPIAAVVERDTQFMTIDEAAVTDRLLMAESRAHEQIAAGAFRTTLPVALHAVRAMEWAGVGEDRIRMVLKGGHWLIAAMLIFAIHTLIARIGKFDPFELPYFIVSLSCLFLLPVTNMAIKTFNYDSISMLGSVAALLLVCLAFTRHLPPKNSISLVAIVAATLAAQEKLSASPILCLALVAHAILSAQRDSDRPMSAAVLAIATGLCISVSVSTLFTLVYAFGYPGALPSPIWMGITDSFSSWTWIPLQILSGQGGGAVPSRYAAVGSAVVILLVAALLGAKFAVTRPSYLQFVPKYIALLTLMGLSAGLISTAILQPYWAPFHPSTIPESFVMNNIWLHFGFSSRWLTGVAYVGYAFEIMVVALPTFTFTLLVVASILVVLHRREEDHQACFMMAIALGLTLIGALLQVPIANRYLSIPLMLMTLAALLIVFTRVTRDFAVRMPNIVSAAVSSVCVLLLIWEVLPFRPFFGAFRPFWLNYTDANFAEPGRLNPSWMGWGEERALLGKKFAGWCETEDRKCVGARIYHLYYGRWLPERQRSFVIHNWADVVNKEPLGDNDFYMFPRTRIVQGMPQPKSKPVVVLAFRGYEMAWLYRGSDLAREDYRFGRP